MVVSFRFFLTLNSDDGSKPTPTMETQPVFDGEGKNFRDVYSHVICVNLVFCYPIRKMPTATSHNIFNLGVIFLNPVSTGFTAISVTIHFCNHDVTIELVYSQVCTSQSQQQKKIRGNIWKVYHFLHVMPCLRKIGHLKYRRWTTWKQGYR